MAGHYVEALTGFVQWMAGRYDQVRELFASRLSDYRTNALSKAAHARTPDIVAGLEAAFELYLEYSVAIGAITAAESSRLAGRSWEAMLAAGAGQTKHQQESDPAGRFLNLLRSVLSSGRAHLEKRNGGEPDELLHCLGWRRQDSHWSPLGDCIGWIDREDIYLEPTASFRAAQIAARDSGEAFAISEHTLKKRLREKDLLASVDEARQTLTVRRSISGSSKSVLHFRRSTILPEVPDADEDAE